MIISCEMTKKTGFLIEKNRALVYITPNRPRKNIRAAKKCAVNLRKKGYRRVLFPLDFPFAEFFAEEGIYAVPRAGFMRAVAPQVILAALRHIGKTPEKSTVCIASDGHFPEIESTVSCLYRRVKNISFYMPRGGERLRSILLSGYGVAAQNFNVPPEGDLTVEFTPCLKGRGRGPALKLYDEKLLPEIMLSEEAAALLPEGYAPVEAAAYMYGRGLLRPENVSVREIKFTW